MKKEQFLELLSKAKQDEEGRLYVDGAYNNRIYFGIATSICEDFFKDYGCEDDEIYDRHWWNDDTLEIYVISDHTLDLDRMLKREE